MKSGFFYYISTTVTYINLWFPCYWLIKLLLYYRWKHTVTIRTVFYRENPSIVLHSIFPYSSQKLFYLILTFILSFTSEACDKSVTVEDV